MRRIRWESCKNEAKTECEWVGTDSRLEDIFSLNVGLTGFAWQKRMSQYGAQMAFRRAHLRARGSDQDPAASEEVFELRGRWHPAS